MHILVILFVGLIIGVIATLLMPGRNPGGFIVTILLAIGGALDRPGLGLVRTGRQDRIFRFERTESSSAVDMPVIPAHKSRSVFRWVLMH